MERTANVEVFVRDENRYHIVVEPRTAVDGIRRHLAAQSAEVGLFDARTAGDLGVELLNGKSIDDVLKGAAHVTASYPGREIAQTDVSL